MTTKTKGRTPATRKRSCVRDVSPIRRHVKSLIVRLVLWGLLPAGLGSWLIQRGGLKDA